MEKYEINCGFIAQLVRASHRYREVTGSNPVEILNFYRRQCGPVVRALALRAGDPGLKTRSDHSLNLFLVVPGSTSQLHLYIANWFASGQLGFLTVVVVVFCCFVDCFIGPEKPLWGAVN